MVNCALSACRFIPSNPGAEPKGSLVADVNSGSSEILGVAEPVLRRHNLLSLSGGGYRGLFSAVILEKMELELRRRHSKKPDIRLRDQFSLIAGTSIGGLLACGLAMGISATALRTSLERHGPLIFPRRRFKRTRQFTGHLYDPTSLGKAIDDTLGKDAKTTMDKVTHPVLVPAVSWVSAEPRLFRSVGLVGNDASTATLKDVCLATAAAPTYFPPHIVNGDPLLDGGLVANAPDTIAIAAAVKRWNVPLHDLQVLSIGTAGVGGGGMQGDVPASGVGWGRGALIIDFIMATQERLAIETCRGMLGNRYLRINHTPGPGQDRLSDLDVVDASMTGTLTALAAAALDTARAQHAATLDLFLS
jgi:cGAMP-activated phospholipase